jgi:hypothetical protein
MKKFLSIAFFALLMFSSKVYSQNNLTWNVKETIDDKAFRTMVRFNIEVIGLNNEQEFTNFCSGIRANEGVENCEALGRNKNGNYGIILSMKRPFAAVHYINMAQNNHVSYIIVNGEKKATEVLAKEEQAKK